MKKLEFIGICEGMGYEVNETIDYNNSRRISVHRPGETVGISMTEVNLLDMLRDMNDIDDVKEFMDKVLTDDVQQNCKNIIENLKNKEYVLNNVFPILLPRTQIDEASNDIITTIPSNAEDLIIIYKVNFEHFLHEEGIGSIALTKNICREMDIPVDEMKLKAVENFRRNVSIRTMGEVMVELMGNSDFIPVIEDECNQMIVVSKKNMQFGAYGLADEYTLNKACDKLHTDSIIIIPSSIHEVLIVRGNNPLDFDSMIKDVNESELPVSDRLSDHHYTYHRHN